MRRLTSNAEATARPTAHRLRGCSLGIARHCGWAFRDDVSYPERPRGDGAEEGNETHAAIAAAVLVQPGVFSDEARDLCNQALGHLRKYDLNNTFPEVTFAWTPNTGKARELGRMLDRKYDEAGLKADEVAGTSDVVVVLEDRVVIIDWKSWATSHVAPANENAQLAFGAICAAQVYGKKKAEVQIVGLEQNRVVVDSHELRALDLGIWDGAFRRIVENIPGSPTCFGGHCTWCPALGACPATEKLIPATQLVKVEGKLPRWSTDALGFENDVLMAMNLPALEKAVDAVKKSLKARYPNGIELDNGKIWKPIKTSRKQFDKDKAVQILGARADEAYYNVEVEQWRQVNKK